MTMLSHSELKPLHKASARWLTSERRLAQPRARLLCIPYAGGGASAFRGWSSLLPNYEVWAVQPPGRPPRAEEPLLTHMDEWLAPIEHELGRWDDVPWFAYGHSLGALVAAELSQRRLERGQSAPLAAFVAACAAPHPERPCARLSSLPDSEFRHVLERFGGTPAAILADASLVALFGRVVRADLSVRESHAARAPGSYQFPLVALGGVSDRAVSLQDSEAWAACCAREARFYRIPGGHFFLQTSRAQVIECVQMEIERFLAKSESHSAAAKDR